MSKDVENYVNSLFKDYEQTSALQEFKEEIMSNLYARIDDLEKNGSNKQDAFTKAISELGDITSIADELSRQKRNEIINKMYVHQQTKVGFKHAIGYVVSASLLLFGILIAFTGYYSHGVFSYSISSFMPFLVLSGVGFTFFGLTQETHTNYPMSWKRALVYALAVGVTLFGFTTSAMLFFMENVDMNAVLGALIPFVLPGLGVLGFLLLTEKNRNKPWVIAERELSIERYEKVYRDPIRREQRGMLSGALWIIAAALFLLIGFLAEWKYAIIVILFAVAAEILIEYWMQGQLKKGKD